ncbi:MAG: YhcH/YjgK/YiaL family protein [Eubacterium sp.]|nr:YhcH/YjgK/YiaL family protein [Eubacterium sp.]
MIYTEISNICHYCGIGEYLDKAFAYLGSHPLDNMEPGYYEIDSKRVYMNILDYDTIKEEEGFFEAHAKYADIHMVVEGEELVGVSELCRVAVKTFDQEKDLYEVEGPVEHYIRLIPGKALVTMPGDAHKLKLAAGQPTAVRKAVIKVYVG